MQLPAANAPPYSNTAPWLHSNGWGRRAWLGAAASLPWLALGGASTAAQAQLRIEVTGVGARQLPFSVVPFKGNAGLDQDIAAIVQADLLRSGLFRVVPPVAQGLDEASRVDLAPWRAAASDTLLLGSMTRLADGRFDVRFRLWDVLKSADLGGLSYPVEARHLRLAAHRIADYVYEKLTGDKGVFSTRIAYVSKTAERYALWVADSDGESARAALNSSEPIISPAWSPDAQRLAYVSFESRKPVVYLHELGSGQRRMLANFRGSNSAPAWAPDGNSVVLTLTTSGNSQLYQMPVSGSVRQPTRLTQSLGIDTEPFYGAAGALFFVSDRGGAPQIYRAQGDPANAKRITFTGSYNISPAPSPDGRWLAYVSRIAGAFRLHLMDLVSGEVIALTSGTADESPSFAPNSRLIIYTTRERGRQALMTTSLDGLVKTRLAGASGDVREPAWGPFVF